MNKDDDFQQHLKWKYTLYNQIAEDNKYTIKGLIFFNLALEVSETLRDYSQDYKKENK